MSQYGFDLSTMHRALEEDYHSEDEEYTDEYDEDKISIGIHDDISAIDVKKYGVNIQGIPLDDKLHYFRQLSTLARRRYYRDNQAIPNSTVNSMKEHTPTKKGQLYYEFQYNTRSMNINIPHSKLRNLVWATTKHDVYLMAHHKLLHWSALTLKKQEVIDLMEYTPPAEEHYGSDIEEGYFMPTICTMEVKDNLFIGGGMKGEIICKSLDLEGVRYYFCETTPDANGCINSVEIFENPSGSMHFLAASNDGAARDFDVETLTVCNNLSFPWVANHISLSPDRKLALAVGDSTDGLVVDPILGQTIHTLRGHWDFSFASAWNPDNQTFATGNQDRTCRVWDIRNLSKSIAVLHGNMAAIRCIRYTSDGKFMAMSESTDFLHIFDVASGYMRRQEVEFYGEVSGISFSPDSETLFLGANVGNNNNLMEFRRQRDFSYLDSLM